MILFVIISILGALGLFIFGMKIMSDGIQKSTGKRLRKTMAAISSNRLYGLLTGFVTTSLIQSSSATTVMIVSFVNARILNLKQAISMIMGANIGTTMTVWIIVLFGFSEGLNFINYPLGITALGVSFYFFGKKQLKFVGEFLIGLSLLFIAISLMGNQITSLNLEHNENFINSINNLGGRGIWGILLFILIGTILTVSLQSSSAATALTLVLLGSGLPLELAAAIVIGENIGTTSTANIAAIIANDKGKRAARAHFLFNILGAVWVVLLFTPFLSLIKASIEWFQTTTIGQSIIVDSNSHNRYTLALFHTLFNIITTLFLIGFIPYIEKITSFLIFNKLNENSKVSYISQGFFRTPELSLIGAQKLVVKMGEIVSRLNNFTRNLILEHGPQEKSEIHIRIHKYGEIGNRIENEIIEYLGKLSTEELSSESIIRVRNMINISSDLKRISDLYQQISNTIKRKEEEKVWFNQNQRTELLKMLKLINEAFIIMLQNLDVKNKRINLKIAIEKEREINLIKDSIRKNHIKNTTLDEYNIRSTSFYNELLQLSEKIGDHILNVSESLNLMNDYSKQEVIN